MLGVVEVVVGLDIGLVGEDPLARLFLSREVGLDMAKESPPLVKAGNTLQLHNFLRTPRHLLRLDEEGRLIVPVGIVLVDVAQLFELGLALEQVTAITSRLLGRGRVREIPGALDFA